MYAAEVHDPAVARLDALGRLDRLVHAIRVVVAGHDEAAHVGVGQPLPGQAHPALERHQHHLGEPRLALLHRQRRDPLHLVGRHQVRVHAVGADAVLQLGDLLGRARALGLPVELRDDLAVLLHHRDDDLARDVAAHDDHRRLVDGGRLEELAPQHLRPVDVGGVVHAQAPARAVVLASLEEAHPSYSGGSSR